MNVSLDSNQNRYPSSMDGLHDKDANGNSRLHLAARDGNVDEMGKLYLSLRIDETNNAGKTPLLLAAEAGHVTAVEWLLGVGAHFHSQAEYDVNGEQWRLTPLQIALVNKHYEVVAAFFHHFIQYPAEMNFQMWKTNGEQKDFFLYAIENDLFVPMLQALSFEELEFVMKYIKYYKKYDSKFKQALESKPEASTLFNGLQHAFALQDAGKLLESKVDFSAIIKLIDTNDSSTQLIKRLLQKGMSGSRGKTPLTFISFYKQSNPKVFKGLLALHKKLGLPIPASIQMSPKETSSKKDSKTQPSAPEEPQIPIEPRSRKVTRLSSFVDKIDTFQEKLSLGSCIPVVGSTVVGGVKLVASTIIFIVGAIFTLLVGIPFACVDGGKVLGELAGSVTFGLGLAHIVIALFNIGTLGIPGCIIMRKEISNLCS